VLITERIYTIVTEGRDIERRQLERTPIIFFCLPIVLYLCVCKEGRVGERQKARGRARTRESTHARVRDTASKRGEQTRREREQGRKNPSLRQPHPPQKTTLLSLSFFSHSLSLPLLHTLCVRVCDSVSDNMHCWPCPWLTHTHTLTHTHKQMRLYMHTHTHTHTHTHQKAVFVQNSEIIKGCKV